VTVNVASDAASPQVNTVTVAGGGAALAITTDSISVTAGVVAGSPAISDNGVVSAAGFTSGTTRGSIATIFGTFLASGTESASTVPLPTTLGNVQVSVNGVRAPLFYVSPKQINFQVPFEAPLQGTASVTVIRDGVSSSTATIALAPYAPAVFTYSRSSNTIDPIIVHATTNQVVTPASPAVPGEYVMVYATGIGDLTTVPVTGNVSPSAPLAAANATATATIGGAQAPVSFAGLTPGAIGLAQFNVQVPGSLPAGSTAPLVISFNGAASQPVQLYTTGASQQP
jgi:uncharacterized protein (TIGR03437 family)